MGPEFFTNATPDTVESATLVATIETTPGGKGSMLAGAVYRPLAEIVPKPACPPAIQFTLHTTSVLLVPLTVALNCCVAPGGTVAELGDTDTVIEGGAHNSGS